MLTSLFRKPDAVTGPCAAALAALKERSAALRAEDETWAVKELAAGADVRRHDDAQRVLTALEEQHIGALADVEVNGSSATDPLFLEQQIAEQRQRVSRLADRRRLADAVLVRVRAQRGQLRTEQIALSQQHAAHLHAAVIEQVRSLAPEFLAAERAYLDALARVFGASRLADRIGKEMIAAGQSHPGWSGDLNVNDVFTPRPAGDAFKPVPQRDTLHRAIEAEVERLRAEFT